MRQMVYPVMIDIKDGWYDVIHVFSSREVAEQYVKWQEDHNGDHCYVLEHPLEESWTPPQSLSTTADLLV